MQRLQRGLCVQAEYVSDGLRQRTVGPLIHVHELWLVLHKQLKYQVLKTGGVKIRFFFFSLHTVFTILYPFVYLNAFLLRTTICEMDSAVVKALNFSREFAVSDVPDLQPCHIAKFVVNFEEFLAICLFPKHSADARVRHRWD